MTYIVEIFSGEGMVQHKSVEIDLNLLNDRDLDSLTTIVNRKNAFVRRQFDTMEGYFLKNGIWHYGGRTEAENEIKRNQWTN